MTAPGGDPAGRSRVRTLLARAATRTLLVATVSLIAPTLAADAVAGPRPVGPVPIAVEARTLDHFSIKEPERRRFGALEWIGGLVLSSRDPRFGGYSALASLDNGRRIVALSDEADWFAADLATDDHGGPTGIAGTTTAALLDERGRPFEGKRLADSESFALCRIGGRTAVYVGFEQVHRVLAYAAPSRIEDAFTARPTRAAGIPAEIARFHANAGLESIACAPDGHPLGPALVLVGEEPLKGGTDHPIWIVGGPRAGRLALKQRDDFAVTDAAFLPSGDLLVLERKFRWWDGVRVRIRRIAVADLVPGALVDGKALVEADLGDEIDNMEGLAVDRAPDGALILTLVSDDNKSPVQRTLLLRFRLPGE